MLQHDGAMNAPADSHIEPEKIKQLIRVVANAVVHGETQLLPLLQRLEHDYAEAQKSDPAAYARQLLSRIA